MSKILALLILMSGFVLAGFPAHATVAATPVSPPTPTAGFGNDTVPGPPLTTRGFGATTVVTPKVYDVQVIGVDSTTVLSPASAFNAAAAVKNLDANYSRVTNGMYRFRFVNFTHYATKVAQTCDVNDLAKLAPATPPKPTSGAITVLQIYATGAWACGHAGEAQMPGTLSVIHGYVNNDDLKVSYNQVLVHEIGHNLGLGHSNSLFCAGGSNTPNGVFTIKNTMKTCKSGEYGGLHSWMADDAGERKALDATDLYILGLLPPQAVLTITTPQQVSLAPLYTTSGVRLIVLALPDRPSFTFEYHRAVPTSQEYSDRGGVVVNVVGYDYYRSLIENPKPPDFAKIVNTGLAENFELNVRNVDFPLNESFNMWNQKIPPDFHKNVFSGASSLSTGATVVLDSEFSAKILSSSDATGAVLSFEKSSADVTPPSLGSVTPTYPDITQNWPIDFGSSPTAMFTGWDTLGCKGQLVVDNVVYDEHPCRFDLDKFEPVPVSFKEWKAVQRGVHKIVVRLVDSSANTTVLSSASILVSGEAPTLEGPPAGTVLPVGKPVTLQFYASPSDVVTLTTYTPTGSTSKLVTMPHVGIYEMATTTVVVPNAASVRFVASTPEGNSATVWYKTSHYVPPPLYAVSLTKVRTAPTYAVLQTSGCTGKVTCVVQRKLPTGWVDYLKITSVPFKTVRGLTIRVKGTAPGAVVYSTAVAT